jgi:hypothetical protein
MIEYSIITVCYELGRAARRKRSYSSSKPSRQKIGASKSLFSVANRPHRSVGSHANSIIKATHLLGRRELHCNIDGARTSSVVRQQVAMVHGGSLRAVEGHFEKPD